ncbi:MAG: carboxypeptidase regulatory-like domain-containing protein [Pseudomonadota bacterium]
MEKSAFRTRPGVPVRLFILFCLLVFVGTATADGTDWLLSRLQPGGVFSAPGDTATPFQSSSEAVRALVAQGRVRSTELSATLQYLQAESAHSTEGLSRQIVALVQDGGESTSLTSVLAANQGFDGGFGETAGFNATVMDTALALEALSLSGYGDTRVYTAAVAFLADRRAPGGGWGADPKQPASAYVTAQVLRAIWPLRHHLEVGTLIAEARSFLLSDQGEEGGWNANALETAAALVALYPTLQDKSSLDEARQRLLGWQHADGSWGQDVYVTALALRALAAGDAPFADLGVVEGSVIDGDTGAPLVGVSVTLTGEQSWSTATDSSGSFHLEDLEPGTYELGLALEGYASLTASLQLKVGTRASLGALQMLPASGSTETATVTGQVTRADTGAGLADATVRVSGTETEAVTDSEGRYQLAGLAPGTVTLVASKAGFRSASASPSLTAGQMALFSPALSVSQTQVSVEGTVTRASDATPLAGATINVQDAEGKSWNATTDSTGAYRIEGLSTGTYTLTAEADGYWPVSGEATADSATVIRFAPVLIEQSSEAPAPEASGGVRVVVRDAATGQAVAGATVTVETSAGVITETTTTEGEAILSDVPAGAATLSIVATDFDPWQTAIEVSSVILLDFGDVDLYPAGYRDLASLSGTVIDATSGSPLEGVSVTASYASGSTTVVTDAGGAFLVDDITDTEAELHLQKDGYGPVDLGLVITLGS